MTTNRTFIRSLRSVTMLLCAVALAACEKNAVQDITGTMPGARIRFFNFGVNAPGVNFYANNDKVTAVLSATGTEATTGVAYGGVGGGGFYSALQPGQYTFTGRIAAAADKDLAVSTVAASLADGKAYSMYISGFYNTTAKTVEAFVIEDNVPATSDYTQAQVRFVNAISNSTPTTLTAREQTTGTTVTIGNGVAYKAAGAFVSLPGGIYDLTATTTGANPVTYTRTGVTFGSGRVYSISSRGDITVGGTTATNRAFLDFTSNR
ncbi:DUF4397 domain-containing protein [Gemmatimonas aurantiaca]|uniref:DUF4397 domain-containing protein n=1 Tax=Gemmatimonas aurantiaca TaxID=173480 RepID=UPI00301BF354